MNQLTQTLASVVASALFATSVVAQSTVFNVESEPAPSLTVQPPLPGPLAQGVAYIPYRLENLRIVPVVGGRCPRDLASGGAPSHHARRSALAVGGLRREQHDHPRWPAAWRAQIADRGSGPGGPSFHSANGDVQCARPGALLSLSNHSEQHVNPT